MKPLLCSLLLLFAFSLSAQAPVAVPIPKEPHHHLVLENSCVRVFRVSIPANDATLLHQHDVPYIYVALGPADVINAVAGKPEARIVMTDGQVGYSRGGFAHIARTDAGSSFNNVTIELLHPQGEPRNVCKKVVEGPVMDCSGPPINRIPSFLDKGQPLFQTGEVFVNEVNVPNGSNHLEMSGGPDALLVLLANPGLSLHIEGQRSTKMLAGEVVWLPAGKKCSVSTSHGVPLRFLTLTFHDDKPIAKP